MSITRIGTYGQLKGTSYKLPCRLATTVTVTLLSPPTSVDGITVALGDRILVWKQSNATENGIYIVGTSIWTRDVDFSIDDDVINGIQTYVNEGDTYSKKIFVLETPGVISLGSTLLVFNLIENQDSGTTQGPQGYQGPSSSGGNIITTNPNTGINVSIDDESNIISTIYNTALDPTLVMPNAVGGIPALTTVASLSSLNFVQIFNDILFPTQNPTYTIPVISLSSTVTSTREIGQTFSPVVTLVGTKNDAAAFSQLTVRKSINGGTTSTLTTGSISIASATTIANQFGYTDPNNPNFSYTVSTTDSGLVVPAPASGGTSSTVTYSGLGDYAAGLAKKNNKGFYDVRTPLVRNTAAPQAADTNFAPTSRTITGYYPYFYGKASTQKSASDIVSIIQSGVGFTKVIDNAAGSLSMTFGATGEWPWFATYSTYATKTTWVDNANSFNNGTIGGATDLFTAPTELSIISFDGYWTTTFKIYPSNKVTTLGSATIA